MLYNYLKVALRSLARNKVFSFINIFGLAIGLTTCLLIMFFIFSESGYDQQNKDADLIYRVPTVATLAGQKQRGWAAAPPALAWALKTDLPEVAVTTRLLKFPEIDNMLLTAGQGDSRKQFYESNAYYVDSTFFRVFTYDFKYGDAPTALDVPNSVVLSETVAQRLFGNENPVGRPVTIGLRFGNFDYTVRGVFRDKGLKSHIPAHFFLSMHNSDVGGAWVDNQTNWVAGSIFHTYIRLKKAVDPTSFEKKINAAIGKRGGTELKEVGISRYFFLQPLTRIYLYSQLDDEIAPNGNVTTLYILGSIAAFILLIACINFMNLSTARSGKRAKEVGVRKVMGAERRSLVYQFLGESIGLSILALLLALALTWLLLPLFNTVVQKQLQLFDEPRIWAWVAGLTLVTGILAGLYPAFYLSSFRPIAVLKGKLLNNFSALTIRKGLIVFQFTISICLVSGAIIIARQLNYLNTQPLGFNKEQQIVLPLQSKEAAANYTALKNELANISAVRSVTCGETYPGITSVNDMVFYAEGKTSKDQIDFNLNAVEGDYFQTLGLTLLEGRTFSKNIDADSGSVIVNETALRQLGYDRKTAIGRKIYTSFTGIPRLHNSMEIIGVVKDFNFESLYNPIKPYAFTTSLWDRYVYAIASLGTNDYAGVIKKVAATWKKINPSVPFSYSFLDKDFQQNYEKDQRTGEIVRYFTIVTILIACLGLFGLSVFSAEQRTREIGIRKVLGASVTNITLLLSRDFLGLVVIAILIASPLAWYGMHKWLEGFAYRISISWWLFPLAGLIAVAIAWLTVSFQAIKAAIANPVRALRSE
ncbi:ABC transporter permease [Puia dinghuensis]|uniref:ABC transporter permease n=1 Tax=Puia dinghuensis TaxID=1792502 RepID=A0A8J2UE50_9BACT|nr:ABC transporter permease [Puia dinghuensis]GGB02678.1 ABC transporter permease [Puia dinghuensis]